MNNIEVIICLLLLFMAVPDLCARIGRRALVYPVFVIFGVLIAPLTNAGVLTMLHEAGQVGFLLLLFQVGLEIDLPAPKVVVAALRFCLPWVLVQYPLIILLATAAGLGMLESIMAASALTGVSVSLAYPAWKFYPGLEPQERLNVLQILVMLETFAIVLLAVESPAVKVGITWGILFRLVGIITVVYCVSRFAPHFSRLFERVLKTATHWRTHLVVLLVLVVCAVGNRLGLPAAKTAFFLGLFMSRVEHDGKGIEEFMAPISQRFLIPIFFISVGLHVQFGLVFSWIGLLALGSAGFMLGLRRLLHQRAWPVGGGADTYLLLCPNLTIVALGATTMIEAHKSAAQASWLLLTGLFMTISAILLLPATPAASAVRIEPQKA